MIGYAELFLILGVALLVLGPSRLPEVARSLGGALKEFKKASDDVQTQVGALSMISPLSQPEAHVAAAHQVEAPAAENEVTEPTGEETKLHQIAQLLRIDGDGKSDDDLKNDVINALKSERKEMEMNEK